MTVVIKLTLRGQHAKMHQKMQDRNMQDCKMKDRLENVFTGGKHHSIMLAGPAPQFCILYRTLTRYINTALLLGRVAVVAQRPRQTFP